MRYPIPSVKKPDSDAKCRLVCLRNIKINYTSVITFYSSYKIKKKKKNSYAQKTKAFNKILHNLIIKTRFSVLTSFSLFILPSIQITKINKTLKHFRENTCYESTRLEFNIYDRRIKLLCRMTSITTQRFIAIQNNNTVYSRECRKRAKR